MKARNRAARASDRDGMLHYNPMVMAAWLYFRDGLSQQEIADRMTVSRATVSNLLAAARDAGVYRITFDPDVFDQMQVAEALKARFGLTAALIVPSAGPLPEVRARVASAGALHVAQTMSDCNTLGICWGQTMLELGDLLDPIETRVSRVYQMVGIARTQVWKLAEACNSRIAHKLGADVMQFPAPGVVSSRALFDQLIEEPIVAEQFDALRSLDAAVFGICSTRPDSPFFASGLAQGITVQLLAERNVAGIIGGRMFDINGDPVTVDGYDDRLLALTLDELRRVPMRLGVAAGLEKTRPIIGALAGGMLTALATDFDTAQAILSDA
jgi:dihydroxyacetone kinase-like protein